MLIVKGLVGGLLNVGFIGTLLLIPAGLIPGGTWYWPRALLFLATYGVVMFGGVVWLATTAPSSLEARLQVPASQRQPVKDRVATAMMVLSIVGWLVFIPVDVFYLKLLPRPSFAMTVAGAVLAALGFAVILVAIYQNSFAKPIVEVQTERGQTLVDTGLYGMVRHPLYMGMLPFVAGTGLWLESYMSVVGVLAVLIALLVRIRVEEETLEQALPGYTDYMERVPYRIVPRVW